MAPSYVARWSQHNGPEILAQLHSNQLQEFVTHLPSQTNHSRSHHNSWILTSFYSGRLYVVHFGFTASFREQGVPEHSYCYTRLLLIDFSSLDNILRLKSLYLPIGGRSKLFLMPSTSY
ncbi:hypothetical protein Agabi119p4_2152 [Agaricus bisporus var. burnettii]|uniref:Uncharacterized protein n=1 Tax=Agaricus bisporus var. burnettii TaxID=192524 RepID=A0A8H7KJU7_AGABI|nr:hypothetical protein Agabi119p4_2152 [Agaricus bisporus var. burnettii]